MHRAALAAAAAAVLGVLVAPASAAPTEAAELRCGEETHLVTGFGRGQVLHVVDSTAEYVVTRAETDRDPATPGLEVVFDNPGLAGDASLVPCTATSPVSDRFFVFQGFFTPAG